MKDQLPDVKGLLPMPATNPPADCRQRLWAEGKPIAKSNCAVCGQFSPRWKECDAMLAAAPVPPAGDVEVVKVQYRLTAGPATGWSFWFDGNGEGFSDSYEVEVRELVDRAHVTRLQTLLDASGHVQEHLSQQIDIERIGRQSADENVTRLTAERDGLLGGCADLSSRVRELEHKTDYWKTQNEALQSELTKAQELLMRLRNCKWIPTAEWQHEVSEVLAHQSAPAAKGGE